MGLRSYRFKSDEDIKYLFQREIDKFPVVNGVRQICEFGAVMLQPHTETKQRLTHLVFPETMLMVPDGQSKMLGCNDHSFCQIKVLLESKKGELLFCISYLDGKGARDAQNTIRVLFNANEVFLTSDLLDYFNDSDKKFLMIDGFKAGMSLDQWRQAIECYSGIIPGCYDFDEKKIETVELPFFLNSFGNLGTRHTFSQMPGFSYSAITNNRFSEEEGLYEIGSAHIHPPTSNSKLVKQLENRIGYRKINMTVSPNDVRQCRGSVNGNNLILSQFGQPNKDTCETFMTIIGVNEQGKVWDIQHCDFGLIDNIEYMRNLNDRTLDTFRGGNPDVGLIAEHYEFFNNHQFTSNQLGENVGQHIGDPDFEGYV